MAHRLLLSEISSRIVRNPDRVPENVRLTQEKETLLITLYCRAMESKSTDPILRDAPAEAILDKIDYDFSKLEISRNAQLTTAIRAKQLDLWAQAFIAANPNATVLHLGCGLDSRPYRLTLPAGVRWYDVDYPEVIELRRRLYPEQSGYQMISTSVTEPGWLEAIPADNPALIIAEGLTMYLSEKDVKTLFQRIVAHFPTGQLAFDAYNSLGIRAARNHKSIRATGAVIGWGTDSPRELESWNPRLKFIEEWSFMGADGVNKLPPLPRFMLKLSSLIPKIKNLHRLLRYQF
jgi:methyltransferase (TIGR00027 family)